MQRLASETRTILIALFRPFSIRMVLKSDLFATLAGTPGIRIVLLVPDPELPEIASLASAGNVTIEKFDTAGAKKLQRATRLRWFLRTVRLFTYNSRAGVALKTRDVMAYEFRAVQLTPQTRLSGRMLVWVTCNLPHLLGRSRWLRRAWRGIERILYAKPFHDEIFARHAPDLLIVSSLGYAGDELLIWNGQKRNVRTLSIIQSWDNTTNKGYPGSQPDRVVAWSEMMRGELTALLDVPDDRIYVGGVPHWDNYFRRTEADAKKREEILSELGVDPAKKIILVSLSSYKMHRHNVALCRALLRAISDNRIRMPAQILIRPHPAYYEDDRKWSKIAAEELAAFKSMADEHPDKVKLDSLEIVRFKGGHDINAREQECIKSRMRACSVLVNVYSTQAIEAAIFDLPIVNVAYGKYKSTDLPSSVEDEFNHYGRIIRSGGVRNVFTEEELFDAVNAYLENPALDREGRKRIVDQEVPRNRGCAGRAIGEHVLDVVYALPPRQLAEA